MMIQKKHNTCFSPVGSAMAGILRFTLIELLVVIAIIGILASISNPDTNATRVRMSTRHGEKAANILYVDGHVDTGFNPLNAPINDHTIFWRSEK